MALNAVTKQALQTLSDNNKIDELVNILGILLQPSTVTLEDDNDLSAYAWKLLYDNVYGVELAGIITYFIFTGQISGKPSHPSYDLELTQYGLTCKSLLEYDENDPYSVVAYNRLITAYIVQIEGASFDDEILNRYKEKKDLDLDTSDLEVRQHFLNEEFNFEDVIDNGPDTWIPIVRTYISLVKARIDNFIGSNYDVDILESLEETISSEDDVLPGTSTLQSVYEFYNLHNEYTTLIVNIFSGRPSSSSADINGEVNERFNSVFTKIDSTQITQLDSKAFTSLMNRIERSGLLTLASYAYEISEFAKRRLQSKISVIRSASEFVDPKVDVGWLTLAQQVTANLATDPLLLATVDYYFPSLIQFFIEAIAIQGDYSDGGYGGSEDDPLNNPEEMLRSLLAAFGANEIGEPIFEWASTRNTSSRIKEIITKSPYFRSNIQPNNPDIFHLRIGAANFYVPPITIDINTTFKTGSLTGSAIRQKSSPKFNSGYKETSIRMRLFFPNYEEIWGLNIEDVSAIDLNQDMKIDFRYGGDSEIKIDKFLSSLRGFIAAFKYSPILPIKNQYLNSIHGITAVALAGMSISTIPNFPFALAVDLELLNFNHEPFLPMVKDFNQAVHWGKYRQYMGKAAGAMHQYVNEEFLIKSSDAKDANTEIVTSSSSGSRPTGSPDSIERGILNGDISPYETQTENEGLDVLTYNIFEEWRNGNHLTIYTPAETQTKIFLPSTASFRSAEEKILPDLSEDLWAGFLRRVGIDINQVDGYGISLSETIDISRNNNYSMSTKKLLKYSIDLLTSGLNASSESAQAYSYLATNFIQENSNKSIFNGDGGESVKDWFKQYSSLLEEDADYIGPPDVGGLDTLDIWTFQGQKISDVSLTSMKSRLIEIARDPSILLDYIVSGKSEALRRSTGVQPDEEKLKQEVKTAFNVLVYERFFASGPIQALLEASRLRSGNYHFNEWEVPMLRVDLDPSSVIINGVTVSMQNTFAKLQVQMHDEPTYQHIGGGDTNINISMTVVGEKELIKLRNIFNHVSGLARLEHATGVIGFLGIKNIITALCGVKYVLPLNYSVNTIPNFPHTYQVQLTLTDFDIFQQKREKLSSKQQEDMVKHFQTKKNPFLRIKQLWGAFNAYPDFPLDVKNESGETVGHLDPDFYFRSFEIFDRDVVNSFSNEQPRVQEYNFNSNIDEADLLNEAGKAQKVLDFMRLYRDSTDIPGSNYITKTELVEQMNDFIKDKNMTRSEFVHLIRLVSSSETTYDAEMKINFLTDYISISAEANENNPFLEALDPAPFVQGEISPNSISQRVAIEAALSGDYSLYEENDEGNLVKEKYVSFHPDEVDFHKQIFTWPASSSKDIESNRIPAMLQTAIGTHYGYVERDTGRFYLTSGGENVQIDSGRVTLRNNYVVDSQIPEYGNTTVNSMVPGAVSLDKYQKAYTGDVYTHWETMMVDSAYRDVSGRMLRAFPTYMLWLIDEGGYFAGVKLFDNFYGLQSIIDFSVVSSEDLLGDTLIFRLSNLYGKLTTKESDKIFNPNVEELDEEMSLTEGLSSIIDRTLNISRNILSGMRNEYIVDINNIRLKPGVRVHLRAGYGSNPNSLQTIFNGVITNVEQGEIVTVTAQSDAIELGAVVNSVNKNGHSGKIDGGIDTGMYLSEPRDLMVRLLSMGSSRTREALARATNGTIFSENRFGIRHFGMILYEPLTKTESQRAEAMRDSIKGAATIVGSGGGALNAAGGIASGFSFNYRGNTLSAMWQLWSNFASEVDLEIFKRNIYPGNGTGMAQFLGGDLDDGWSTAASLVPADMQNERLGYTKRLTDFAWNRLVIESQNNTPGSNLSIENLVEDNKLIQSTGRANFVRGSLSLGLMGVGLAFGGPVTGTLLTGLGLTGILSGRGGTNLFRTLGIISQNPDDDLKGFDEVSFRAQTYMRTVWDIFQTCARLLPNYIVAVRPFEDRSTVFYGKPHWLYTSGVVPVTMGFPGQEKAEELGIILPQERNADSDLISILDRVNRESNSYADYSAFFAAAEPDQTLEMLTVDLLESTGIYAPSQTLAGKVLNFYSTQASTYRSTPYSDEGSNVILAKIPVTKGFANVGLHLPIDINNDGSTAARIGDIFSVHKQINNLTPRYAFPYFIATSKKLLENSSTINSELDELFGDMVVDALQDSPDEDSYNNLAQLAVYEYNFFVETKQTLIPSEGNVNYENIFNLFDLNQAAIESSLANGIDATTELIRMPLPNIGTAGGVVPNEDGEDLSFEYDPEIFGKLTYEEWGSPKTVEDEQFYIAMRWPYNPPTSSGDTTTLAKFKEEYGFENLYGSAEDYKNRKILVYNPVNRRSVICRPAYFLWGEEIGDIPEQDADSNVDAIVSPDAAFYLGIITRASLDWSDMENTTDNMSEVSATSGYRVTPKAQECLFAFVPDNTPLGVVSPSIAPAVNFKLKDNNGLDINDDFHYTIGFGTFTSDNADSTLIAQEKVPIIPGQDGSVSPGAGGRAVYGLNNSLSNLTLYGTTYVDSIEGYEFGGNILKNTNAKTYFQAVLDAEYETLERRKLWEILDAEKSSTDGNSNNNNRVSFAPAWDPADLIGIKARSYYDENYDPSVSVIAGDGRTLNQATDIWDQFRFGYHTYESVKQIFFDTFGLDADDDTPFPAYLKTLINPNSLSNEEPIEYFKSIKSGDSSAIDEFAVLLGSDYYTTLSTEQGFMGIANLTAKGAYEEAVEYIRKGWIDAGLDEGGLINYFNTSITRSLKAFGEMFFSGQSIQDIFKFSLSLEDDESLEQILREKVTSAKQLFLILVGLFRQRLWEEAYGRAWLVLKPDRKKTGAEDEGQWSFRPVDKVFRAFINPYTALAKSSNRAKFTQLLVSTRGEGSSTTNIFGDIANGVSDFWNDNIGPIFTAIGDGLGALMSMFQLSMQQLGFALGEVGNFKKQAHILNKVLNDSIYYSLGQEGSLLRAVDNPFTREYGEPVIEIREPFQRIHYISSFSHIISNQIQENLNNVSTVVTAVSDGKYPVTVALDKGAPSERQVEKTVESGIYFDNMVGSGFLGFLHPLFHPLETVRGIAKNIQGTPDELTARRIALSHLKESIKDIYQGELIILGNGDIRPHDLIYIADVYERMYGIFEVEQVVHHFTSDLGFITSITPNAIVSVNDPAKWFMTSWIHSWMNVQSTRNQARIILDRVRDGNAGFTVGGNISIDALSESLTDSLIGGIQFTHGSSALAKDAMANQLAQNSDQIYNEISARAGSAAGTTGSLPALFFGAFANTVPIVGQLAWSGWKWVRDNVLDQHGCYVQYLNKNGQPMDAGLSYNQGMVVGMHHSKALLPGILGVRRKVRTAEGYTYVRSDDLFQSLGWKETEISDLVRYTGYQNALIHARVLNLSGLGPEKASLQQQYRVIVKVTDLKDGDTIDVEDILSGAVFTVRFDGINTSETNQIEGKIGYPDTSSNSNLSFLDLSTPGGAAKEYVRTALSDKIFIVRINPTRTGPTAILDSDYEPGAERNNDSVYEKDQFNRSIGTIFHSVPPENIENHKSFVAERARSAVRKYQNDTYLPGGVNSTTEDYVKESLKASFDSSSIFFIKFNEIYNALYELNTPDYYTSSRVDGVEQLYDPLWVTYIADGITNPSLLKPLGVLVNMKILEELYIITSMWPQVSWDEYYQNGQPYTLNWELVVNNLAKVYVKDLQRESQSVQTGAESVPQLNQVQGNSR